MPGVKVHKIQINKIIRSSLPIFLLFIISLQGCSRTSNFYVEDATLSELDKHNKYTLSVSHNEQISLNDRLFMVKGHRISEGADTVLAYRFYYKPLSFELDNGAYEKVTILLPSGFSGNNGKFDLGMGTDIIVFYSKGASSFPTSGCFGYAKEGFLEFSKKSPTKVYVIVSFKADLISPSRLADCKPIVFRKNILLKQKSVSHLSPWDGTGGSIIVEETHYN